MCNNILLSFIVPCYNVEAYIQRCFDSILSLDGINFEIIAVNDGSSDRTGDIIKKYAESDLRITVVERRNGGLSSARNSGLNKAKGKYVWFIDSDDYLNTTQARHVIEQLYLDRDAYFFGRQEIRDFSLKNVPSIPDCLYSTGIDFLKDSISKGWYRTNAWDKIFKADIIRNNEISFKEGLLYEDMFFCLQYFTFAQEVQTINSYPYCYYLGNTSSITHSVREKDLDVLLFIKEAKSFSQMHAAILDVIKPEIESLLFNWTSSCLLNKYIPLASSNIMASRIVDKTINDETFRESAKYCLKHRCRFRYKLFASLLCLSPILYKSVLKVALKLNN